MENKQGGMVASSRLVEMEGFFRRKHWDWGLRVTPAAMGRASRKGVLGRGNSSCVP